MIPNKIGKFNLYRKKPSSMKYGNLYFSTFLTPFNERNRLVYVWVPSSYKFEKEKKKYPVIYFSDGQNLFEKSLSGFGDWDLDNALNRLEKNSGKSAIVVGVACPKTPSNRSNEYNPPFKNVNHYGKEDGIDNPYGDVFIDWVLDKLKPVIDKTFSTSKRKEDTAIGGSSMGGIMSFYSLFRRRDKLGFALSFSPAFFLYNKKNWIDILTKINVDKDSVGKLFLYCGDKEYEHLFLKSTLFTYEYLREAGFDHDQLEMIIDSSEIHHEKAWDKYSYDALDFWLNK